jgi:hypothetical protein
MTYTVPSEHWEVDWVQYQPNRERVLLGGSYRVRSSQGRTISEFQNIETTQTALQAKCPEGVDTWGDEEIAAVVTEALGIPCVFVPELVPEPPVEEPPVEEPPIDPV